MSRINPGTLLSKHTSILKGELFPSSSRKNVFFYKVHFTNIIPCFHHRLSISRSSSMAESWFGLWIWTILTSSVTPQQRRTPSWGGSTNSWASWSLSKHNILFSWNMSDFIYSFIKGKNKRKKKIKQYVIHPTPLEHLLILTIYIEVWDCNT